MEAKTARSMSELTKIARATQITALSTASCLSGRSGVRVLRNVERACSDAKGPLASYLPTTAVFARTSKKRKTATSKTVRVSMSGVTGVDAQENVEVDSSTALQL